MMTAGRLEPAPDAGPERGNSLQLLAALRREIETALFGLVRDAEHPALLEFPAHPNVGDSAIWLGEIAFLAERLKRHPVRTSDVYSYSRERLAATRGLDLILLHGGGNLGDLWKGSLDAKIRVLDDFPDVPIVQLPQTIHFQDPARLDAYRRAVDRHRNFTLLVRDRDGFDMAGGAFDCEVRLCPDMALWLTLQRPARPVHDVVCLLRTDIEARAQPAARNVPAGADAVVVDWLDEPGRFAIRAERALTDAVARYPRKLAFLERPMTALRHRVAWTRVRRGCAILSAGRAVVTDRLHGHILCVLMDIPHVVLDNSYGKLSHFYDSWTRTAPGARFAPSLDAALAIAAELAADAKATESGVAGRA
jgi:pyruvyl transferase EpsO